MTVRYNCIKLLNLKTRSKAASAAYLKAAPRRVNSGACSKPRGILVQDGGRQEFLSMPSLGWWGWARVPDDSLVQEGEFPLDS